jgi:hypothetical protein
MLLKILGSFTALIASLEEHNDCRMMDLISNSIHGHLFMFVVISGLIKRELFSSCVC